MKYTAPVKKIRCQSFDPTGVYEMSCDMRYKRGRGPKIPLGPKTTKKFLLKNILNEDHDHFKRGWSMAVTFEDVKGTRGVLITKEDL